MTPYDDPIVVGVVRARHQNEFGISIQIDSSLELIPFSAIHVSSEVRERGDIGYLIIKHGYAKKQGWVK